MMKLEEKQKQSDKFKQTARDREADQDETRWQDRLNKIAKHKPVERKTE